MQKRQLPEDLSRRSFLKLAVTSIWGLVLAACGIDDGEDDPTPLTTPTQESTSTNTPTQTATPTETLIPCFYLLAPEDEAEFGTSGWIKFEWSEQFGAVGYRLEITYPNGNVESKEVETTSYERYLESLPVGGEYGWQVTALGGNGEEICIAGPRVFYKEHFMNPQGGEGS